MFGIIKETGVDDNGLMEFHNDFFSFPLYRDSDLTFYQALGNRKLSLPWNPITIVKGLFYLRGVSNRVSGKKIEGNLTGEGMTKGGVIIFGKDGKQKYAYPEVTFEEMPVDDILAAAEAVKAEQQ